MASVKEQIEIPAPADAVWQIVRDFGAIDDYVPPITSACLSGEGLGAERTLTLADGGEVTERLTGRDEADRTLRYTLVEGPLPVKNYEGRLSVDSIDASSCAVTWASTFDVVDPPEEAVAATFSELYAAGLAGLKQRCIPRSAQ
ncbi:MAG: SRPBCC family protein [Salinibacter sp.]|uniref:SRPBCC family protein n=1 Tax=Salinibacter sp. TaxID=2065818 RepID=UPI002FC33E6A